ncbi:eukaryotic translation initiation factor subunit eIF-4F [Phyllosticta capitalensis]
MTSPNPKTVPTNNAAQTANAASTNPSGTTSPSVAGAAQPIAKSYASAATKKAASPPAIASSSPQVAVGSNAANVNGKTQNSTAGPPPIANGAPSHGRKSSTMTISAAGATGPMSNNGNARPNIAFGAMNAGGSPAIAHSAPHAPQNNTPNPRITSPATSPSPIPQPAASGGRPPSGLQGQGNGLSFGSMGGENVGSNPRPVSMPPQGPPIPQPNHLRRESSQSAHSDMSNAARNFVPQAGRGRGYSQGYNAPSPGARFSQPMRGPMPGQFQGGGPMGSPYRQNRSPAMAPATMSQQASYANQPQLPHGFYPGQFPSNVTMPISSNVSEVSSISQPAVNSKTRGHQSQSSTTSLSAATTSLSASQRQLQLEKELSTRLDSVPDFSPENGGFEEFLTVLKAQNYYGMHPPSHLDPTQFGPYGYQAPYMHPGMAYQGAAPPSPRPMNHPTPHGQPFVPGGQYAPPHAPVMSRNSSQVSERPPSTLGQPQTPSMAPASHASHTPTQSSSSPAPASSNFTIPARTKSKGIVIKNPEGEVVTFEKKTSSPAPPQVPAPSKSPVVVSSTPTPPPRAPSATDSSKSQKTEAERRAEFQKGFQEQIRKTMAADQEAEKAEKAKTDADTAKASKEKEESEAKAAQEAKDKEAAEAAAKEAAAKEAAAKEAAKKAEEEQKKLDEEKKQAEEKAKDEESKKAADGKAAEDKKAEEERIAKEEEERWIAELEAAEREEEEREKAYQEKKKKEAEEAKSKEAEKAAKADEEMKRLEREAEERELAKEKGAASKDESEEAKAEAAKLFASLKKPTFGPAADAAAESQAATPVSDTSSMPPPAQPASKVAAAIKPKPAALKLETRKPVEPPAPTPGMQALKSARFLQVQSQDVKYPAGIKSPNPALNQSNKGTRGLKYDKDFLLQFQEVFKEKPSVDWDTKVRETVGDGSDSARPQSARTPSGMGGRQNSRPMGMPSGLGGPMGSFAQGGRTLPPGTSSQQRFEMSQGVGARPPVANPLASFAGRPGSFPMGGPVRSASSYNPAASSPRSGSGRKNASRAGGRGPSRRDEEQAAKNMPLTAGVELKPLQRSQSGWVPTSLTQTPQPVATGNLAPDVVQRKVKAALNKMTPEKFDKIADQILEIAKQSESEADGRTLRQVIQLTFEKACDEAHWASMYAKFCKRMLETMSPNIKDENVRDKNGNPVVGGNLFRKYLLNRCQEDFEQGWESNLPMKKEGETEEAAMLSDEYYVAAAAKRKGLGLIQFIGELYKLGMLTVRIMHECVMRLLNFEGMPDESNVESLVKLLRTVGANMEANEAGSQMIRAYFDRIEKVKDMPGLPSRLHFMLLDLVDLRRKGWRSKDDAKGPKTLQEIHEEALAAQQAAELEKMRNPPRGGGRPPVGRGDARSFSGAGSMPPPDYKHNTLGMDDLRKLSKNASGRTASSGPGMFGPSSLFAGRSSSGRRNLGPGGGLNRTGDESGGSSRTGTPPVKDKESSTHHVNSFSALAALEGGEDAANDAASPEPAKVQLATDAEKKEPGDASANQS